MTEKAEDIVAEVLAGTESSDIAQALNKITDKNRRERQKRIKSVKVVRGDKLIVPEGMPLKDAIKVLKDRDAQDSTEVQLSEPVNAFPLDGAFALSLAIEEIYGYSFQQATYSMFGKNPPQRIAIMISPTESVNVPWGKMTLPNVAGSINAGAGTDDDGQDIFVITAVTLKRHEAEIQHLARRTREIVREKSIYRGHALKIDFKPPKGGQIVPEFMPINTSEDVMKGLILSEDTQVQFEESVLVPIMHSQVCRDRNIPLKRGILLEGPYGTGKTLSAYAVAQKCSENGWTFIYIEDSTQLRQARMLASRYAPAVVFAEDLDRILSLNEEEREEIRNVIDGIDTKQQDVMIVCTTNCLEELKKANLGILRPGRLDALIHVGYPDADAAARLVRYYGHGLLAEGVTLEGVGALLNGQSAAMVREVVDRAKLGAIRRGQTTVNDDDLVVAGKQLKSHMEILGPDQPREATPAEELGQGLAKGLSHQLAKSSEELAEKFGEAVRDAIR